VKDAGSSSKVEAARSLHYASSTRTWFFMNRFITIRRSFAMAGKGEEIKGRVKEAAGAITDNDKLRREGKIDQSAGKVKQAVEKAVDKTKQAVQRINKK